MNRRNRGSIIEPIIMSGIRDGIIEAIISEP
jgi:hypothetical protein